LTLREIVQQARGEGGFDASEETVKQWALDRYRRLVAESQWRRVEVNLSATVVGQAQYSLPDVVVDVRALKVGDSPYKRISVEELWDLKAGISSLAVDGAFTSGYDVTEVAESIEIYPVPETSGDVITALAAIWPADISLDTEPRIPRDFDHVIVEGVMADGLGRIDERLDQAAAWEGMFATGVEKLRRRRNSRVGSGPVRIRVGR